MLVLHPRQLDIMEIAEREGRVTVETLAERFKVTHQTIRKDLNDLCNADRLHRVHGGAIFPSNTTNLAYQARRSIATSGKRAIARAVADIIPDGASIILNIGTTTELVAEYLKTHKDLMVITNNLNVATILCQAPGVELIVAGGIVRKADGGIVGTMAMDVIHQFKVDFAIVGVSAIDDDGSLLDFDYREVQVSKTILAKARKKILVADKTKFERRAPVQVAELGELDQFVTDVIPNAEFIELCKTEGVELIVAHAEIPQPGDEAE